MSKKIVITLGGNALGDTPEEQKVKIRAPAKIIAKLAAKGYDIIVGHGNGPQVGSIFNAFNVAHRHDSSIPAIPFAEAGAMSQGYIGIHINNALANALNAIGVKREVIYFLTQTIVNKDDEAFSNPTKPIGLYYKTKQEAIEHNPLGSKFVYIRNQGYRRVVPSPKPVNLLCLDEVRSAIAHHKILTCGGGGGVPIILDDKTYKFVEGVIDKDFVASLLADRIDANILVILTNVPHVCINYGTDREQSLTRVSSKQIHEYIKNKEFGIGSMLPKVQAAVEFVEKGKNRKAIIARLEDLMDALKGKTGTTIYK